MWSANGKTVACARPTDLVQIHDAATGRETRRFRAIPDGVPARFNYVEEQAHLLTFAVALSPDGKRAATRAQFDGGVHIWDVADGAAVAKVPTEAGVGSLAFTPDGRGLVVGGGHTDGVGERWDVAAALAAFRE